MLFIVFILLLVFAYAVISFFVWEDWRDILKNRDSNKFAYINLIDLVKMLDAAELEMTDNYTLQTEGFLEYKYKPVRDKDTMELYVKFFNYMPPTIKCMMPESSEQVYLLFPTPFGYAASAFLVNIAKSRAKRKKNGENEVKMAKRKMNEVKFK